MECCFASYDEFITEYQTYRFDECSNCNGCCELIETDLTCTIEGRILHFSPILVLRCKKCGNEFLPEHTKQMIDGAYRTVVKENQTIGEFHPTGNKKKFEYCTEQNYDYDHRDYYNIPGLCYDEEHSVKGFLTPVYFEKEALVFFLAMPEYEVEIFSESYGYIAKKDFSGQYQYDWNVPFGFNTNGRVIRDGVIYRDSDLDCAPLIIKENGDLEVFEYGEKTAQEILDLGGVQTYDFGPTLIKDNEIIDNYGEWYRTVKDPRTVIGQKGPLEYVVLVADGRSEKSEGISLYDAALELKNKGCYIGYNLDGGGSTTLYFNGEVLNNPSDIIGERRISDILYFKEN